MTFSSRIQSHFDPVVRMRGLKYFEENRVQYRVLDRSEVQGSVKGTRSYPCQMVCVNGPEAGSVSLRMECACPHFERGDSCKHLWALALALDSDPWTLTLMDAGRIFFEDREVELDWDEDEDEEDWDEEEDWATDDFEPFGSKRDGSDFKARRTGSKKASAPTSILWDQFKKNLVADPFFSRDLQPAYRKPKVSKPRALCFVLDLSFGLESGDLGLKFYYREHLQGGRYSAFKPTQLKDELNDSYADPQDQELMLYLTKECDGFKEGPGAYLRRRNIALTSKRDEKHGVLLPPRQALGILLGLAEKSKLYWFDKYASMAGPVPLKVSLEPWHLEVSLLDHDSTHYRLGAMLSQGDVLQEVEDFRIVAEGRFVLWQNGIYPSSLFERKHRDWLDQLAGEPPVIFRKRDLDTFIADYSTIPMAPTIRWPEACEWLEVGASPRPRLRLVPCLLNTKATLAGAVIFQYPPGNIEAIDLMPNWVDPRTRTITSRDFGAEKTFLDQLHAFREVQPVFDPDMRSAGQTVHIPPAFLAPVVEALEEQGWDIDVDGKRLRMLHDFDIKVEGESDTDWFDLSVTATVDSKVYRIPQLLENRPDGELFINLGRGELALLPEKWLKRFDILTKSGQLQGETIRFPSQKLLLLDNLLADLEGVNRSQHLRDIRQKVQSFKNLQPVEPPQEFQGVLRPYQKEGLAWLEFLREFGFGGCLADEMGLGKTVQVLAMLLRFHSSIRPHPSLIVVPRSLVGNWLAEAAQFAPTLRAMDLSGSPRDWSMVTRERPDIVIVTYGTLRQDIKELIRLKFSYVILDESQAIKNAASQAAKACRLLKADHRLAMSGTPIENHMSELMSLMGFLNPGLMEGAHWQEIFKKKFDPANPHLKNLTAAIRPLMLRRTKAQVLEDLPPKVEYTLYCELEGQQKAHYEELKRHYQMNLLPELHDDSWRRSSIVVIEALLRLRQAACHSGLVDKSFTGVPSAKLEALFAKLEEIRESGHKALIFSQFTSFLKMVAERMTRETMPFEYLDGKTRDRAQRVARFQNDPHLSFFLISLKAGGVGLNLTAADYCFLLDPWWNPAAEAQAIDRAHRIHQKNTVFAYRIIARGTVEEKIQLLQKNKRDMMESVLEGEGSLLQHLDLESIQSLFF